MFTIKTYVRPESIDEAYEILNQKKNAMVLGGCGYLRMGSKMIDPGIDLTRLGLNRIEVTEKGIEIGSEVSFGDLERSPELQASYGGLFEKAVRDILGVQFRNTVKTGATVYSRYGFSDLNAAMLALGGDIHFGSGMVMRLEDFFEKGIEKKDFIVKITLPLKVEWANYVSLRNSKGDYALLNMAASRQNGKYRICVGAKPTRAKLAVKTMAFLNQKTLSADVLEEAAEILSQEMTFGSNRMASAEYRKAISRSLFVELFKEVL